MNLQDSLMNTFGCKIERYDMFANWTVAQLSKWKVWELKRLFYTILFFKDTNPALAHTLKERLAKVMHSKYKQKTIKITKVNIRKSKGKRQWLKELNNK